MRAPEFWQRRGLVSAALSPLGALTDLGGRIRLARAHPVRAPIPVICIGNLSVGGAGKTPLTIAAARRLKAQGHTPHIVTRGHGGNLTGPVRVSPDIHGAADVGDEALLHAAIAPTWVARDRAAGAARAADDGADCVILDDGFQNPSLAKDLSILAIDGGVGFGNRRVMPAGPLRESLARGLARADAAVIIGDDATGTGARLPAGLPLLHARIVPRGGADEIGGKRVVAFAGIGRPAKFFATLTELGCTLIASRAFDDHHPYREDEVMTLIEHAAAAGAIPVTTAKDAVRLPTAARAMVRVLEIGLDWEDAGAFERLIARVF